MNDDHELHDTPPPGIAIDAATERKARLGVIGMIMALALFAVGYRVLLFHNMEQTAALFIGLPTFLAVLLVLTPRSRTVTGMLLKGTTLALLVSAMLFQEGFICVLMAAPLFYGVAAALGIAVDMRDGRGIFKNRNVRTTLVVLPLLAMSLEGTTDALSFARDETVSVTRVVSLSPAELEKALATTPSYDAPLPFYLRLGFPRPVAASGAGLDVGDTRTIHFSGGEGDPGDLVLVVGGRSDNSVRFTVLEDSSHIAHWLTWQGSEVSWTAHSAGTQLTWTEHWRRDLDPAWYFAPAQRYAMRLAIHTNIDQLEAIARDR